MKECCSEEEPCGIDEGHCDRDAECRGNLVCGMNNCGPGFRWLEADCCQRQGVDPGTG